MPLQQYVVYIQRGDSALMWADETAVVKELAEAGADLNLHNEVCQHRRYMMYMYMNSCNVHIYMYIQDYYIIHSILYVCWYVNN